MLSKFGRFRPSHATTVAYLALFVALGGTSVAAVKLANNSVGSKQIVNGQVKRPDIRNNAVNSAKVANGSLRAGDFAAGQLPAGPKGDKGDTGPPGSDAQFNGAAAGGDLTGTYPNPTIAAKPAGAISAPGTTDGPGNSFGATGSVTQTEATAMSITVHVPASGRILLMPEMEFGANATAPGFMEVKLKEGSSQLDRWDWDPGDAGDAFDLHQTHSYLGAVTGGTHTYDVTIKRVGGTADTGYFFGRILAVYLPGSM